MPEGEVLLIYDNHACKHENLATLNESVLAISLYPICLSIIVILLYYTHTHNLLNIVPWEAIISKAPLMVYSASEEVRHEWCK